VLKTRHNKADEFYSTVIPRSLSADQTNVMRQALAGMMWTKQYYHYDVNKWLSERGSDIFKADHKQAPRNDTWHHMYNGDIISMPDKWEHPWYAAWDFAFHCVALPLVDLDPIAARRHLGTRLRPGIISCSVITTVGERRSCSDASRPCS